jgi:hypothetical protein
MSTSLPRRLAVGALIAGVALQVTETLLWPPGADGDTTQMLRSAGAHQGRYLSASVCETLSWLLVVPAVLLVIAGVHGRGRVLTRGGGGVFVLGSALVGAFVSSTMNAVAASLGQRADQASAAATWHSLVQSPVLVAFVVVLLVSELALVPFAVGLVRAGLAGWWLPVLTVLAIVGGTRTESAGSWWGSLALDLPFVLVLLWMGRVAWQGAAALRTGSVPTAPAAAQVA